MWNKYFIEQLGVLRVFFFFNLPKDAKDFHCLYIIFPSSEVASQFISSSSFVLKVLLKGSQQGLGLIQKCKQTNICAYCFRIAWKSSLCSTFMCKPLLFLSLDAKCSAGNYFHKQLSALNSTYILGRLDRFSLLHNYLSAGPVPSHCAG